jgi:putative copper export protein
MASEQQRHRWRKATWALVVWSIGITIWMIVGLSSRDCQDEDGTIKTTICEVGTAVGTGVIAVVGVMGFVVLSLIWLMSRPRLRICPSCGNDVEKGATACGTCGHDFSVGDDNPVETS